MDKGRGRGRGVALIKEGGGVVEGHMDKGRGGVVGSHG